MSRMMVLRNWCELVRLPKVLTAMADPLAGALIVGAGFGQTIEILAAMVTAAMLYISGVILNDWYDYKKDLVQYPSRPLPSKRIKRYEALAVLLLLLVLGSSIARMTGRDATRIAMLLLATILLYDTILKNIPLAPLVMGVCRSLNLMFGMAIVSPAESATPFSLRLYLAVAMLLYVTGMTIYSRSDSYFQGPQRFVTGAGGPLAAIGLLMIGGLFFPAHTYHIAGNLWAVVLAVVLFLKMVPAIKAPNAQSINLGSTTAVFGLVAFNATAVALYQGIAPSLLVLALLFPVVKLHHWLQGKKVSG